METEESTEAIALWHEPTDGAGDGVWPGNVRGWRTVDLFQVNGFTGGGSYGVPFAPPPADAPSRTDVPLPAAAPLLLGALGGLAWLRRRKASSAA